MKKIGNIGGIISGFISIIFAFKVNAMSVGLWESSYTYGGDAYTGIQNAAAQAANNAQYLAKIVRTGVFGFLLVFGLALICFFITQLASGKTPGAPAAVPTACTEESNPPQATPPVEEQQNSADQ